MSSKDLVRQITENVLRRLGEQPLASATPVEESSPMGLFRTARTQPTSSATPALHPALTVFQEPEGIGEILEFMGEKKCVIEPDKPCINSGRCKSFGH